MILSLVLLFSDLANQARLWAGFDFLLANLGAVLGVRSAASRVIVSESGLELHGVLRRREFVWGDIAGFEQSVFLWHPANYVRAADCRRYCSPSLPGWGSGGVDSCPANSWIDLGQFRTIVGAVRLFCVASAAVGQLAVLEDAV